MSDSWSKCVSVVRGSGSGSSSGSAWSDFLTCLLVNKCFTKSFLLLVWNAHVLQLYSLYENASTGSLNVGGMVLMLVAILEVNYTNIYIMSI